VGAPTPPVAIRLFLERRLTVLPSSWRVLRAILELLLLLAAKPTGSGLLPMVAQFEL